jgi:hypothetical protein
MFLFGWGWVGTRHWLVGGGGGGRYVIKQREHKLNPICMFSLPLQLVCLTCRESQIKICIIIITYSFIY